MLCFFNVKLISNVPRPESYRKNIHHKLIINFPLFFKFFTGEDKQLVKQITKPSEKHRIWRDVGIKFVNDVYY